MRDKFNRAVSSLLARIIGLFPDHLPIVYKISLMITGLVVICSGTLSTILVFDQTRIMEEQIEDFGSTVVSHLARAIQEPLLADDRLTMEVLTSSLITGHSVIGTEIISPKGDILAKAGISPFANESSSLQLSPAQIIGQAGSRRSFPWQLIVASKLRVNVLSFISPVNFRDITAGYALVTFSKEAMDSYKQKAIISISIATVMITFLGVILAYILSKQISRPVHHFMRAIKAFDSGDYNFRFDDRRRDEIGQLMNAFDQMAAGMVQKNQVEKALDRYLSPQVAKQVITNLDSVKLGGKRITGSILFADIVGFTRMSESMDPEEVAEILNRFFYLINLACEFNLGTVDKYTGDGVMLLFGAPVEDEEHAFHAASCGLLISRLVDHENEHRQSQGAIPINFRIGINAGSMLAGNMGSREKMEYTVVGDTVNLASRFCSIAEAGQIVVSRFFYDQENISQRIIAQEHMPMKLRGIEGMVDTFLLQDLAEEHQPGLEEQFRTIINSDRSQG
jgi:adenylate cyclase